jgi:hypothetical protein
MAKRIVRVVKGTQGSRKPDALDLLLAKLERDVARMYGDPRPRLTMLKGDQNEGES